MKLTQIRHFVAVAERGSSASGAEALNVSHAALMRSLQALERALGVSLFRRDNKALTLTAAGEIFLRRVAAAQVELNRACEEVRRMDGVRAVEPTGAP